MRDWTAPRKAFIEEGKSLAQIARESSVPYSTLTERAKRENWRGQREAFLNEDNDRRLERLTRKLLDRIDAGWKTDYDFSVPPDGLIYKKLGV